MLIEVVKVCTKCKLELPLLNFSKNCSTKDGLRPHCKQCIVAYRELNKDKIAECRKAHYEANKATILDSVKVYREGSKVQRAAADKVYRELNKDKLLETRKVYYEAHKLERTKYNKDYYQVNKGKLLEAQKSYGDANKVQIAIYKKEYGKANPAKLNALGAKRHAKKLNATPKWLTVDDLKQIESFYTEAQNLNMLTGVKHHVDHIVPL